MSEPVSDPSTMDWEAVMAEALAASGGPLTADEREWAASTFGLSFGPATEHLCNDAPVTPDNTHMAHRIDAPGQLL